MSRMNKISIKQSFCLLTLLICCPGGNVLAEEAALKIISSSDPGSNKNQSFIYIKNSITIEQGVSRGNRLPPLKLQIPFVVDIPVALNADETVQWIITTKKKEVGAVEILSKHKFTRQRRKDGSDWSTAYFSSAVEDSSRLVFRPKPHKHEQSIYKKGRGGNGKRQRYGGGTPKIDEHLYNPRLSYELVANVKNDKGEVTSYKGKIEMDNKDMVRQEYINHFRINRYGRGGYGNLPVPLRSELSDIPPMPTNLLGNGLSESRYGLMVDDGLTELAINVVQVYEDAKKKHKQSDISFNDLNKQPLPVPESKLWLSGGWRNPERNEWYSNALNGIHQRGGAIDIVASEPHSDRRSAIVYWFLWKALQASSLDGFWQLETRGRPMVTREFKEDIEPKNGIPDAFDKADHIHINIKYE